MQIIRVHGWPNRSAGPSSVIRGSKIQGVPGRDQGGEDVFIHGASAANARISVSCLTARLERQIAMDSTIYRSESTGMRGSL